MKTIGLIGGMSWESTASYYQIVNSIVGKELGGLHSAKVILYSVDFYEIEQCQASGDWDKSAAILSEAAVSLQKAGADFIVICTNTMHKVVDIIEQHIQIPILHIADTTGEKLTQQNIKKVALLGTKYTMTQDFYKSRLQSRGIEVMIPSDSEIEEVNRVIYEELCVGVVLEKSKRELVRIIKALGEQGAQGVILGCTELGTLVKSEDCPIPVFDTTVIHAMEAVAMATRN